MITKGTAQKIWNCYEQIERCKMLISDMKEELEKTGDERLIDAFGEKKGLQLGVPCGSGSHRLFDVRVDLAMNIISSHIEDNEKELLRLKALAEIELKG